MADLRQRIKVDATLKDGVSRGLEGIRRSSDKSLGDKTGLAAHAGKAKLAMAGLATGVVAVGAAVLKVTRDVARHNDEIAKMSLRIGASTEALSQYEFVAKRSGVEFRTLTMGWQRMTRRISEAAKGMGEARGALKELNLSAAALNELAPEDQFEAIADAMQGVTGQADKVRLAMKLFDSEGVALVQTMEGGAKAIRAVREEAHAFGVTLTGETAAAAAEFQNQLANLTARTDALKKAFAEGLIVELGNFEDAISGPDMKESFGQFGGFVGAAIIKVTGLVSLLAKINEFGLPITGAAKAAEVLASPLLKIDELIDELAKQITPEFFAGAGRGGFTPKDELGRSTDFTPTSSPTLFGMDVVDPASLVRLRRPWRPAPQLSIAKPLAPLRSISMSRVSSGDIRAGEVSGKGYGLGFQRGLEGTTGQRAGAQGGTILSLLAFGRATDPQAVIDRLSDKTGDQAARQVLQGWRTRIAKDGDQDIVTPFGDVADSAGELFTENLQTSLTLGLAEFILEGDLKSATKTFGATLAAGMVVDAAAELSEGITKKVGEAFKEGGFAREHLISAGQDIGRGLKTGANFALESLQVPDSFAARFGVDGSVGKEVATRFGDALAGGVTAAAIGTMLFDEITANAMAIGGALGGALAGPVGTVIGSITGAVASKIPVLGDAIDNLFGVSEQKETRNLLTDVRAFGGVEGYIERIGGFEGVRGDRARQFLNTDEVQNAFRDLVRVEAGATREQAEDVVALMKSAASRSGARAREGAEGERDRAQMIFPDKAAFLPSEAIRSSVSEIQNVLAAIGFTDEQIADLQLGSAGPGSVVAPVTPITSIVTEPDPHPSGGTTFEDFFRESDVAPQRRRLSISEGRDARSAGYMSIWAENLGATLGSTKARNIFNLIDSAGQDQGARQYLSEFYDIVAARGYHGTVNRPTTILAGERGPERVDITPGGAGFMGGASGSGGTVVHFNVNVQALDPRGVRDLMEGEVGDMLIERIRASSERGETVIYSSGVTTPPSV